jgi:hypothetical protein
VIPPPRRRVADDHVDERVVEDLELGERVDEAADMVVGVLEEARVGLHRARQHGASARPACRPTRDLLRTRGQLGVLGDDAERLLAGEALLPHLLPARSNFPLYLLDHSIGT